MLAYTAAFAIIVIESDDLAELDYHGGVGAVYPAGKAVYALLRDVDGTGTSPVAGLEFPGCAAAYYEISFGELFPACLSLRADTI